MSATGSNMHLIFSSNSLKNQHKGWPLIHPSLSNSQGWGSIPDRFSQKDLKVLVLAQQLEAQNNLDKEYKEKPGMEKSRKKTHSKRGL